MSVAFAGARVQREKRHAKGTMTATGELGRDINSSAGGVQYRLPRFGVDWHMHGPRPARRSLFPFALALGALALAFYVATDILVGSCNPVISPAIPLGAGGLCVAAAVVLWLLNSYRRGERRKPGALHWIAAVLYLTAILGAGLIAGATTTIIASFSLIGDSLFGCPGQ